MSRRIDKTMANNDKEKTELKNKVTNIINSVSLSNGKTDFDKYCKVGDNFFLIIKTKSGETTLEEILTEILIKKYNKIKMLEKSYV